MRYERTFGAIKMPEAQQGRTIAPFNVGGKGEA
jgi:hypothetical protein